MRFELHKALSLGEQYAVSLTKPTEGLTIEKKEGAVYTPLGVVQSLLADAFADQCFQLNPPTVLDPACGCGAFLIPALQKLIERYPGLEPLELLDRSIFGVDLDAKAAATCRQSFKVALSGFGIDSKKLSEVLERNIRAGHSLLAPEELATLKSKKGGVLAGRLANTAFSWNKTFPQVMTRGGFDIVIGNPPYGLSREERISKEENEAYKRLYTESLSGKPNKYLLFLARGVQLLRRGGTLAFLIPNSWLGIRSAVKLRQSLAREKLISSITVFDGPVFGMRGVEVVSVVVKKRGQNPAVNVRHLSYPHLETKSESLLPWSICLAEPRCPLPVYLTAEAINFLERIAEHSVALSSSGFIPQIAIQAYAVGRGSPPQSESDVRNRIYDAPIKLSDEFHPYLEGRDIKRYAIQPNRSFLRHGPWLAEPQSLARFSGPRIVVREVMGKAPYFLQAALLTELALYNKSVLHIKAAPNMKSESLWALLAVLNSKTGALIAKLRGRKSMRRLFPKVVKEDLDSILIPRLQGDEMAALARLAVKLSQGNPDNELENEVERAVLRCYGLPPDELQNVIQIGVALP